MTIDLMSAKTNAELTDEIEDLQFANLFLSNKVKELEEKRVYYRKWREDQFKILFDILRTKDNNKEETEKMKIRLKGKDIHERFFYIKEELKNLTKVNRMMTTIGIAGSTSVMDYYNENVGDEYLDEDTSVINAYDVLSSTMKYVINTLPCEIRDSVCEEMADDIDCIPNEIAETVIQSQLDDGNLVSNYSYDEKCEECDEFESELDKGQSTIYKRIKKHDELKDFTNIGELYEAIDYIFDNYDKTKTELQKFKSGYETLKECNEENDMIEMMEKIMNKTEEVANTDVKRCEEINRLKEKVNNLVFKNMTIEKVFILGGDARLAKPFHSICVNRGYIEKIIKDSMVKDFPLNRKIKVNLSHYICEKISNESMKFINDMVEKNDSILRDKIHEIIQTHMGNIFKENGDTTYIKYLCPELDWCVLDKDMNRHTNKDKFHIDTIKAYELKNKRYCIGNYNIRMTNKDEEEEIKDIHNY